MSFYSLGFTTFGVNNYYTNIVRIPYAPRPDGIWMRFETNYGIDETEFMDISACFRGITKGNSEYSSYGDWSHVYYQRIPCKDIECIDNGFRFVWRKDLNLLHPSGNYNLVFDLADQGIFDYDHRKYDAIQMDLGVDRVYADGTKYNLSLHNSNLYIFYRPWYRIDGVEYTRGGVTVNYSTAADWTRTDDQFYIDLLYTYDAYGNIVTITSKTYGSYIAPGKFMIPFERIKRMPDPNAELHGDFYIAPKYDPDVTHMNNHVRFDGNFKDMSKCNPIDVSATDHGHWLGFYVTERKEGYDDVDRVVAKLEAMPGEKLVTYDFDTQTADTLPATFQFDPPFNKKVLISFTPYGESGTMNEPKYYEAYIKSEYAVLTSRNSGESVLIRYNFQPSFTSKPDANIVKLAGRESPSAFYGTGGTIEGTITGTIVDTYCPNVDVPYNVEKQDVIDFESIHFAGDCLLRTPDTMRRLVSVSSIDVSTKSTDMMHVKDVTIKMTGVG